MIVNKIHTDLTAVPNITVPIGSTRELAPSEILSADSTDYLLGGSLTMKNGRIDRYLFDEGYCQAVRSIFNPSQDGFTFYYYDRDHLGSVRQVIEAEGTDQGTIVQKMNYYPSGLQFCNNVTDSDVQPQRYNGKELDGMHGLNTYDYGARQYNPVTARWDRMDPLCEKYYSISPYAYCGNNPMNYIDPDGRTVKVYYQNSKGESYVYCFNGKTKRHEDPFVQDFINTYWFFKETGGGDNVIKAVEDQSTTIYLANADEEEKPITEFRVIGGELTVYWESRKGLLLSNGGKQSAATRLEHEFDHANDSKKNPKNHNERREKKNKQYDNEEEKRVIEGSETKTAKIHNEGIRYDHKGKTYETDGPTTTKKRR